VEDAGDHAIRVSVRNAGSVAAFDDTATLPMTITTGGAGLQAPPETLAERIRHLFLRDHVPVALGLSYGNIATPMSAGDRARYYLYTPELNLLAETVESAASAKPIEYEYVWFGGQPLAQIETATLDVRYYFNDHLGSPVLTTGPTGNVTWRVEREPFGERYAVRAGSTLHQPLALSGQEDHGEEMAYNIFRWYRAGWGRYSGPDRLGLAGGLNLYAYVGGNPLLRTDPYGLVSYHETLTRSAVSANDLYNLTKSTHTNGATFFEWSVDCGCSPACRLSDHQLVYKMNVSIQINFHVWVQHGGGAYSDIPGAHWASENEIFFEEMKHVIDYRNVLRVSDKMVSR